MNGSQDRMSNDGRQAGWTYTPSESAAHTPELAPAEQSSGGTPVHVDDDVEVEWSASEFIAHHKGASWYTLLLLAALAAAGIVYLITHDVVSSSVIIVVAVLFGITASHKPRVLKYRLDQGGLTIGQKFYPYGSFKAFSVIDEGSFSNITFVPLKRFMPSLSVYYAPEGEQKILDALSAHLPMEQVSHDTFDRIMRRVRF